MTPPDEKTLPTIGEVTWLWGAEEISWRLCGWLRWEMTSHTVPRMTFSVDSVVERLGGAEAAARLTGVGTEAVRKWRQAGSIPSRHWPAVIAATGLTFADLSDAPG